MTFSETLFMFSRGRRFYEIVGKYYLLKTSTEQIFYSDWNRRRSVKLYSCFPDIEGFMRLRANILSAQIDGSEIGVGGTRQARQIRSICLSNMKIFLKVVNTQQVYLESDIQHLPMPHFWDITSDHITFISLNDGSRESIALLYLLLFLCEMPWASEYNMSPHDWHILKIPSGFQPLCKQWWLSVILWSAFPLKWVST